MVVAEAESAAQQRSLLASALCAVDELLAGTELSDVLIVRAASRDLRHATRATAVASLTVVAAQREGGARAKALRALASVVRRASGITHRPSVALATGCLGDFRAEVRLGAAQVLAGTTDSLDAAASSSAAACLSAALGDGDDRVAIAAAKALAKLAGRCGDAAAVAVRKCLLHHRSARARQAAAAALVEIAQRGDAAAVASLGDAARGDEDWHVRAVAARGLPRLAFRGDEEALTALGCCLRDEQSIVRKVAQGAIVHVSLKASSQFVRWGPNGFEVQAPAEARASTRSTKRQRTDAAGRRSTIR
mmetsp:Transcript_66754/g.186126  ORF Transcript_66754/g.186126 Transcript_66754/m.186126 type:complete len:306 (-) Transcript_66754:250-1167(-)